MESRGTAGSPNERGMHYSLPERRPRFLDCISSNPDLAFREFYDFVWRLLGSSPPRALRTLPPQLREDVISEVIVHCWKDDQRVLKKYEDRGLPFAYWLLTVAGNRARNEIRRQRLEAAHFCEDRNGLILQGVPSLGASVEEKRLAAGRIEAIRRCLHQMSPKCRLLLVGSAEGMRPRELAHLLGWPRDWGKKASDDLRACRQRLRKLLEASGHRWACREGLRDER